MEVHRAGASGLAVETRPTPPVQPAGQAAVIELRLRTRAHPDTVTAQVGKHLTDDDYDVLLSGPARVLKPDGRPLVVYLPGQLRPVVSDEVYGILHDLKGLKSMNRGKASASQRVRPPGQKRAYSRPVPSAIVGSIDPGGIQKYCRLTAWTGDHVPEFRRLTPLLQGMGDAFREYVPDRYQVQREYVRRTAPEWIVPGTPFSTITVNNTYSTGVHQDAGDLAAGFSCLGVIRRGHYTGGRLCFPEWRVAVDMQDGDMVLMDAHDWHGNTRLRCFHGLPELEGAECPECKAERISVVAYFRERMAECGTAEQEHARALALADRRSHLDERTEVPRGPTPQADRPADPARG